MNPYPWVSYCINLCLRQFPMPELKQVFLPQGLCAHPSIYRFRACRAPDPDRATSELNLGRFPIGPGILL